MLARMTPPLALTVALGLALPLALAPAARAQTPGAPCSLLSRAGGRYSQTPLTGFDPSNPSAPLPTAPAGADAALVLCHRQTIVPDVADYRVPAEAHLPLAITDERATVMLDMTDGRLQLDVRRGQASPDEAAELKARLAEMQSAMQSRGSTPPQGAAPRP